MATNYAKKLADMRIRRMGDQSIAAADAAYSFMEKSAARLLEEYENRGKSNAVKYALGAMQQLEPQSTKVSLEEGERVKNQLAGGLEAAGIPVSFEYQGSVPLNIHIRFSSDIDLLVMHEGFVTYVPHGPKSHTYGPSHVTSARDEILVLRRRCESILQAKFPSATIDKSGAKSVSVSGGSLQRKVDVVPAHWHDAVAYQSSQEKHDREVKILNLEDMQLLANRPFDHMKKIHEKDRQTSGGAKKVIRLLKVLKRDAERQIDLSSYEIAGLVWHFDNAALTKPAYLELSLVAEAQRCLQDLVADPVRALTLVAPDGSRRIIESADKFAAMCNLKEEVDQLVHDIAKELNPLYSSTRAQMRQSLMEAQV